MITVQIPIQDKKNPPMLKFPDRCVNCGKARTETLGMTLQMGVQKRGQAVTMDFKVPMCNECASKERSIAKVTLLPFLLAGLILGLAVFLPVVFLAPAGTSTQTLSLPWIIGACAGLVGGIAAGTAVELIVKTLAAPFYGKLVMHRPLTILSIFSESDQLIGISAKLSRTINMVSLTFENDEIARQFEKMNSLEKS
jgi:hypothetical protein